MSGDKVCDIYTERLYMRKLRNDDLDRYYQIMKKDEVGKWLGISRGKTYDEAKLSIDKFSKHWEEKGYGVWGVIDKQSGELLGQCGLNFIKETEEVEILYAFDPKFWWYGYATESASMILQYAFEKANLDRVIALVKPNNIRSSNVIEKIGLDIVGTKEYFGLKLVCYEISNATKF